MGTRRSVPFWITAAVVAAIALAIGVWAIVAFVGDESPAEEEDVTVEALIEDPDRYEGMEDVTVSGEVEQVGERVFTLGAEIQDGQVIVVPTEPGALPSAGETVRVTGEVRRVQTPESAVAGDTVAVESSLVEELGGGFGIVARTVEPVRASD